MNVTSKNELTFQLSLEDRPADAPALFAYLVDEKGDTSEAKRIDEKGVFAFKAEAKAASSARVLIAPEAPDRPDRPTLAELRELHAYEQVLKVDPKLPVQKIAAIPPVLWPHWPIYRCRVLGRVEKDFCVWLPDPHDPAHPLQAHWFTLPVSPARVHVCLVRPRLIWLLEDPEILRIRADLLEMTRPLPPKDPDPIGPVAEIVPPSPVTKAPTFVKPETIATNGTAAAVPVVAVLPASAAAALSPAFQFKLRSDSPDVLRRALNDHLAELRPFVTCFDWCRLLFTSSEVRVVDVDDTGHFETSFYHDLGDRPDLYFWVEYLDGASWITVYKPLLCHGTFWNYISGSEVILKITDARVLGCHRTTGEFLEVTRIGNRAWLPNIDQYNGLVTGLDMSPDDSVVDAAGVPIKSTSYRRPFGGVLVVRGNFGLRLPDPNLATHYRVSLKRYSDVTWREITTPLGRTYTDTIDLGDGTSKVVTRDFPLNDPHNHPEFYRIPKENASQQTEIPSVPHLLDRRWTTDEFPIAILNTDALDLIEGTYELRIELCRADTPGGIPAPVPVPRGVFLMPDPGNINQSVPCNDEHLIQTTPGSANALAFRMRLKIDRSRCTAEIGDAAVDGQSSDPRCGILPFGATAHLAFTASHPHNRATFSFNVVRGAGNDVGKSTSGQVSAPTVAQGYTRVGSEFSADVPVAQLFATSACPTGAAFAETLKVRAMATDGTSRLYGYDAPEQHAAFAIVKH